MRDPRARRHLGLLAAGGLGLAAAVAATLLVPSLHDSIYGSGTRRTAASAPEPIYTPRPAGRTVLVLPRRSSSPGAPNSARAGNGAETEARPKYAPGQLLVKFENGTSPQTASRVLDSAGADVQDNVSKIGAKVVDVPGAQTGSALATLNASPAVEYAERDVVVNQLDTIPTDPLWPSQWGPALVRAPRAWDAGTGAPGVAIAVLDTGAESSDPELQGSLVGGYDFVNDDADPSDDQGHGTAAAGVIAARTNNGVGEAGLCWKCSLMPVKVLDSQGSGTTSMVAAGIVWATDHGARVISMSLGSPGTTQTLSDAVAYAAGKGVLLVGAAGNAGSTTPYYPAAYPQVISVAGTTTSDALYSWSNYGQWVYVAAPGCNAAPYLGPDSVNFCGTSAATPVVSGLAGLALSARPDASAADVARAIENGATSLPGGVVRYGRIDAPATLAALGVSTPAARPTPATTPVPATTPAPVPSGSTPTGSGPSAPSSGSPNGELETLRGSLTKRTPKRRFTRSLRTGKLSAELKFGGSRALTLAVLDEKGRELTKVSGKSPLRLARSLPAGKYAFVVSGRKARAPFALGLSSIRVP